MGGDREISATILSRAIIYETVPIHSYQMDDIFTSRYVICAIAIIFIIVIIWVYSRTNATGAENLHCGCSRREAAMFAWDPEGKLPPCDMRFKGLMPFKHPSAACSSPAYNPFYPPFSSTVSFAPTSASPYIDVPISRMVGDHVPLE